MNTQPESIILSIVDYAITNTYGGLNAAIRLSLVSKRYRSIVSKNERFQRILGRVITLKLIRYVIIKGTIKNEKNVLVLYKEPYNTSLCADLVYTYDCTGVWTYNTDGKHYPRDSKTVSKEICDFVIEYPNSHVSLVIEKADQVPSSILNVFRKFYKWNNGPTRIYRTLFRDLQELVMKTENKELLYSTLKGNMDPVARISYWCNIS